MVEDMANARRRPALDPVETGDGVAAIRPAPGDPVERARVDALVERARQGDADAFGAIYDRFQPEIVRYLRHRVGDIDHAEDLCQQVFLKAWQAIPRYQQRGAPFQAWLYRMAHNQMVDHFRRQRPTTDLEGSTSPSPPRPRRGWSARSSSRTFRRRWSGSPRTTGRCWCCAS